MSLLRLILAAVALFSFPAMAQAPGSVGDRLLNAHNSERVRIGLEPLRWSPALAAQAQVWANALARRGALEHAKERGGAGENLWMGTAGYYAPEDMIDGFLREARYFRPGRFPDVSTTGKWSDVGHYTQMIWPATRELGCAIGEGGGREVLVCRYYPSGNWVGQQVP
jgi:uncharacterized protein YkwD